MDKTREKELAKIAAQVRKEGLGAIHQANSGHVGGAFSVTDILVTLYFEKMNIDAKKTGLGRQGPFRSLQRTLHSRDLSGFGAERVFPGWRFENISENRQLFVRTH